MDYTQLRAAALRDGEDEEAVTVNTRALIDKILARYSGEWTTLRELIQNAADAQATTVKIKWETLPSTTVPLPSLGANASQTGDAPGALGATDSGKPADDSALLRHTILHHTLSRLLVENDGQPFTKADWARLKRIAEGNPDETKIGAFGVGFYSVFADCEEPFVSSGREAMAFYWKKNALFTRKLVLPDDPAQAQTPPKTTFVLDYRNATTALPNLLSVSRFLATSLTFVALQRIEFWIDDWKILDLHKQLSASSTLAIPRDLDPRTKDGLMTVAAVDRSTAQIDAAYMNVVAWKPPAGICSSGSGASSGGGSLTGTQGAAAGGSSSNSKSNDSYGMSAGDMPSLRGFFSRLTGSVMSSSSVQSQLRSKAAREEKAAQDALQENLTGISRASITLRVTSAQVRTRVAANFAAELERATKKPPPKTTKMAILTASYDDVVASDTTGKKPLSTPLGSPASSADIFASVLPSKKPGGRIFIGFPTMQTTGGGLHLSAPSVIPTVEREAIDLNARWVRTWNMELLRVGGILTRMAFIDEMADLGTRFRNHMATAAAAAAAAAASSAAEPASKTATAKSGQVPTAADIALFLPEALHILKTYTFADSTPSAYVSQIIEEAFWTAYKQPSLDVFSTRGVLPTTKVRIGNESLSGFVDGIPVIVPQMKDNPFVQKIHEFGILHDITVDDVHMELEAKSLDGDQLGHFVKWLASSALSGEVDPPSVRTLLRAAVASIDQPAGGSGDGNDEAGRLQTRLIELGSVRTFLAGNTIPANLPLPPSTLPYAVTSAIPVQQLRALGWEPLEVLPWLEYLVSARLKLSAVSGGKQDLTQSPEFAAQVLTVLSKSWDNLSVTARASVVALLKEHTTMPTRVGMRRPPEAFFPFVKVFDDLPVIVSNCRNLKEKFLLALGVRKTVDLDTIFTRLLSQPAAAGTATKPRANTQKPWSHVELIRYLASVQTDIPSADVKKLADSPICPAEAGPVGLESTVPSTQLYRVKDLFEPSDTPRELGFPILQWPGGANTLQRSPEARFMFQRSSPEYRFLLTLGLRQRPTIPELIEKMASKDPALREKARNYFISGYQTNGYISRIPTDCPTDFVPVMGKGGADGNETLVRPSDCYSNIDAAALGFPILRADLHPHADKFGVLRNPPIRACVQRLLDKPPQSHAEAVLLFNYFATRLGEIHGDSQTALAAGSFVPVLRAGQRIEHLRPSACYLGTSGEYSAIFDFVDFGTNANAFLFQCGSRSEPTKQEIARMACTEPARLLSTLQTPERYLGLLRSLAEDLPRLKADRTLFRQMQKAPFLLASREVSGSSSSAKEKSSAAGSKGGFLSPLSSASPGLSTMAVSDGEDDAPVRNFELAPASQIAVLDDYISYRLFKDKLLCAPEEDGLEAFYLALGAKMLSSVVQEDIRIGPQEHQHDGSEETLRKYVLERSKIFLYEYQRYRHDAIKHDIRWLEANLTVERRQTVTLWRTLRSDSGSGGSSTASETHRETRSAAATVRASGTGFASSRSGGCVLYVSSQMRVDMYQVGQAICQLVLKRPSQQAYFFFEPFLKLDLLDLRGRGYNVDRILREKAAEARIADEERQRALEAEQQERRQLEQQAAAAQQATALQPQQQQREQQPPQDGKKTPEKGKMAKMPGAFGDEGSPETGGTVAQQQHMAQDEPGGLGGLGGLGSWGGRRGGRGLFSNLTRRLGLDQGNDDGSTQNPNEHGSSGGGNGTTRSGGGGSNDDGRVTSPSVVQQNMLGAIEATRPYGSTALFEPPRTTAIKEQATYCDRNHAHDLVLAGQAPDGMSVFVDRRSSVETTGVEAALPVGTAPAVATFERLLRDVAGVYGLAADTVHQFYDATGPTIAFNTGGSLFCNLRYFLQLHAPALGCAADGSQSASPSAASGGQAHADAAVWWWVVLAHELAHNLEAQHNANHSYYTESFIQQYFHRMTVQAAVWVAAGGGGTAGRRAIEHGGDNDEMPPSYQQATRR